MIVRILGEGQYSIPDKHRSELEALDNTLLEAVEAGEEAAFEVALGAAVAEVRRVGTVLPDDEFYPSDLVLPFEDATLGETKELLAGGSAGDGDQ
ncbi:MAG TPA: hypothetical protein VHU17_00275 [Acidimicrobiales bacterium]|jgi:hypothetical protein|nr:hypothetical protein [Acidimicrobiales bacterium]